MREIIKLGLALFIICALAAGALASVNTVTGPIIELRRAEEKARGLLLALPGADSFEDGSHFLPSISDRADTGDVTGIELGLVGDASLGVVYTVEPLGYTQEIVMLVGVKQDGEIAGVQILNHLETPGLGSRIEEEWFREQYIGLEGGRDYLVRKDGGTIDGITAATLSSRSVTEGVNQALRAHEHLFMGQ